MLANQTNKEIARQFLEYVSQHRVTEICEIIAPSWKMHGGPQGLSPGADGIRELFATFGQIEQEWAIEDMIAEGDRVVVRATNTCTQESFLGVPANGKQQVFSAIFIHQIVDGKIVATWRNADDLGRILQLGARIEPCSELHS